MIHASLDPGPQGIAGRLVNELRRLAVVVPGLPRVTVREDLYDNYLLALAMAGAADFLMTGDERDLLGLRLHGGPGSSPSGSSWP